MLPPLRLAAASLRTRGKLAFINSHQGWPVQRTPSLRGGSRRAARMSEIASIMNEHGAMFTPVSEARGGMDYVYCGMLDMGKRFPEPTT